MRKVFSLLVAFLIYPVFVFAAPPSLPSNMANAAITSGTINNATIGATTPAAVTCTTLTTTGAITAGDYAATTAQVYIKGGSGGNALLTLDRTSGATKKFSLGLSGGGLSFTDNTDGGTPFNLFGGATYEAHIGAKASSTAITSASLIAAASHSSAAGSNVAGTSLTIRAGLGTGSGVPGSLNFNTGILSPSGTTAQTSAARMTILPTGQIGVGTTVPSTKFEVTQGTAGPGIVSNSAGGTTVTGTGTTFTDTFKVGDTITINGETVAISAIASDTSMTTAAITGANSGVAYTLTGGTRFSAKGNGRIVFGNTESPVATAKCTTGSFAWDTGFIYICTSTDTWKRAALTGGY